MANKVYIEFCNPYITGIICTFGSNDLVEATLSEDLVLDLKSNFTSMGEMMPTFLASMVNFMRKVSSALGDTASLSMETLLDLPLWTKTEAARIVLKLVFYTKDDPYSQVWLPAMGLASQAILIQKSGGSYSIPGISMATYRLATGTTGSTKGYQSKDMNIISLEIPGVIYLPKAVILSARPTFSKQRTESGYPLWCVLDTEIRSIEPANDQMFQQVFSPGRELIMQSNVMRAQALV